jgi:hypothetical protein
MIDPKEKLHLVKYVKIDGKIVKLWECGICKLSHILLYFIMLNWLILYIQVLKISVTSTL